MPKLPPLIYLAARYSRREELCGYAEALKDLGAFVTSRWLNGNHQLDDSGLSEEAKQEERIRFACEDWEDLFQADICVSFTETPRGTNSRGGRHVEFGAAMAMGKECIVIGHRENVFHCLPGVAFYSTWEECLQAFTEKGFNVDGRQDEVSRLLTIKKQLESALLAEDIATKMVMSETQDEWWNLFDTHFPDLAAKFPDIPEAERYEWFGDPVEHAEGYPKTATERRSDAYGDEPGVQLHEYLKDLREKALAKARGEAPPA